MNGIAFSERGYGDIAPRLAALNLGIEKVTGQVIAPEFASAH